MTARELIEMLKTVDPDTEVAVEGRDSTGEYCVAQELTEKRVYIDDAHVIFFVAE